MKFFMTFAIREGGGASRQMYIFFLPLRSMRKWLDMKIAILTLHKLLGSQTFEFQLLLKSDAAAVTKVVVTFWTHL